MQRKPGFPVANCNIKVPDSISLVEGMLEEEEPLQRRQQLINFGHTQWGFSNWSWAVTKQDLDFVEMSNGKYTAGVVAFVSVTVKTFDIHRENIGYATSFAPFKGAAIHNARKCAVTNALRETLLSFGGNVTTELLELLDVHKSETANHPSDTLQENNQNPMNGHTEPKNTPKVNVRKDPEGSGRMVPPAVKNAVSNPPVAKAHPMPANLPPAANRAANASRAPPLAASGPPVGPAGLAAPPAVLPAPPAPPAPRSNVSFVLQPVMGGVVPPLYGPPRPPPPHVFPNYYEYAGPWHFALEPYDRPHGNVNLNFNVPPKNLVVNGRGSVECKSREDHFGPAPPQGCWIKPTIFYDGFWTEQKVKKWVAEQVEKQFPEDAHKTQSPPAPAPAPVPPKP